MHHYVTKFLPISPWHLRMFLPKFLSDHIDGLSYNLQPT